jgi:hypothetical protein
MNVEEKTPIPQNESEDSKKPGWNFVILIRLFSYILVWVILISLAVAICGSVLLIYLFGGYILNGLHYLGESRGG